MNTALQRKLRSVARLSTEQIKQTIVDCDEAIAATKNQMKTMGTLFKIKTAIPKLRDLDAIKRRLLSELENRTTR